MEAHMNPSTARMVVREPAAPYGVMPAWEPALLPLDGSRPGVVPLGIGTHLLGSGTGADVRLPDPYVSRRHAELVVTPGRVRVRDLGSTNGTQVNGRAVASAPLEAGGVLALGGVRFALLRQYRLGGRGPAWEFRGWVGAGAHTLDLIRRLVLLSDVREAVLITGESGSGKEVAARILHESGARAAHPMLAVNGAALDGGLADAELFGHRAGAFTDARTDRPGLFLAAGQGTLFLDEVADLGPEVQAKLLRVLERGEMRRLGEDAVREVRCRVVAATHKDLEAMVAQGSFRADLFHRLDVVRVALPPLRERREDVVPLARLHLASQGYELAQETWGLLEARPWRGNVRELLHVLDRARLAARSFTVTRAEVEGALPEARVGQRHAASWLDEGAVQRTLAAALGRHGGSMRRALAEAGIPRSTYYYRQKHGRVS
jgi:DNA-binding NtrC family response regulator